MLKRTITNHELQINLSAPLPPKQPLTLAHDWPYMYYGYSDPDEHGRAKKLIEMHRIEAKIDKAIHSCRKTGKQTLVQIMPGYVSMSELSENFFIEEFYH